MLLSSPDSSNSGSSRQHRSQGYPDLSGWFQISVHCQRASHLEECPSSTHAASPFHRYPHGVLLDNTSARERAHVNVKRIVALRQFDTVGELVDLSCQS